MTLTYNAALKKWLAITELTPEQLAERDTEFRALIPLIVAAETQTIREQIAAGATYLVNGERNLVHHIDCPTIRHQVDRERLWHEHAEQLLAQTRHTIAGPFHQRLPMPTLLTRTELEQLTKYAVCRTCSPDTDTRERRPTPKNYIRLGALNLKPHHIGKHLYDHDLNDLGTLIEFTLHTTAHSTIATVRTDTGTITYDQPTTLLIHSNNHGACREGFQDTPSAIP